ncbi:MAG: pyrroline-5-carboxylate reductase [Phycisphaerae bacterium]
MSTSFLIFGGGNMATAIVSGAARAGLALFDRARVVEPDGAKHVALARLGLRVFPSAAPAIEDLSCDGTGSMAVLLAVKPQMLGDVAREAAPLVQHRPLVISILAGTTLERLAAAFPGCPRLIRAMPNLPASIGLGATALAPGAGATEQDVRLAHDLFRAVGPLVVPVDESLMDAFTALAGSGPAYLFLLAEAMTRAGVEVGFDAATSLAITRQTLQGAAELLARSTDRPVSLRAAVTSKGGTTAAAISVLTDRGVIEALNAAITAARDRGRELSRL